MPLDLKKEIESFNVVVLVIPNDTYTECLLEISKQLADSYENICYVNMNKLFSALMKSFERKGVNRGKFFFIDAITKSALPDIEDTENCKFVTSASTLQELGMAINNELNKEVYNALIFDSLSTLRIYNEEEIVEEFIRYMTARIRLSNCIAVLTCLAGDTDTQLIKNIEMMADKVIHLEAHIILEDDQTIVTFEARSTPI
ncbi:MAG TPA: hypothetical protein EYP86_05255 [Candidatus Altiarchaeales archaeon]|nr:hypothetical protein [Candidatus Altiarchaeales archaeon]